MRVLVMGGTRFNGLALVNEDAGDRLSGASFDQVVAVDGPPSVAERGRQQPGERRLADAAIADKHQIAKGSAHEQQLLRIGLYPELFMSLLLRNRNYLVCFVERRLALAHVFHPIRCAAQSPFSLQPRQLRFLATKFMNNPG